MTKSRQWAIGTALAVLLVLVAGVLLLVQPRRSEAASLKEQTTAQQAANVALEQKISTLKAQQQDLPRQQARLAQIRQQLPEGPNLPSLVRSMTDVASATGVDLISLAPAVPEALTQPAAAATSATAAPVTPDSAPTVTAGVQQITVTVSVTGTYAELTQFLGRVENLQRSMLVGEVKVAAPQNGGATASAGELQLDLTTRVFMAPVQVAAPQTQTTGETGGPAPSTDSQ
jgi:Tfp pilus assembly protein PilO